MSDATLSRAVRALDAAGLEPIADPPLCRVLAQCPCCRAGDGMYRPLVVACWQGVRMYCSAGCSDSAVRAALEAGPTDWKALAHELLDLAHELSDALDRALADRRRRPLKAAA